MSSVKTEKLRSPQPADGSLKTWRSAPGLVVLTDNEIPVTVYCMPPPEQFSGGTGAGPVPEFGPSTAFGSSSSDTMQGPDAMPAPGELHIKGKRTWKTWQVVVAVVAALLVGMALNYHSVGCDAHHRTSRLTAAGVSGARHDDVAVLCRHRQPVRPDDGCRWVHHDDCCRRLHHVPSSPRRRGRPAPAGVLLGPTQLQGNWTSPSFTTTAAGWNIGWAFRCAPAPACGPSFEVFVTPAGSSPSGTPAISETGPIGSVGYRHSQPSEHRPWWCKPRPHARGR